MGKASASDQGAGDKKGKQVAYFVRGKDGQRFQMGIIPARLKSPECVTDDGKRNKASGDGVETK